MIASIPKVASSDAERAEFDPALKKYNREQVAQFDSKAHLKQTFAMPALTAKDIFRANHKQKKMRETWKPLLDENGVRIPRKRGRPRKHDLSPRKRRSNAGANGSPSIRIKKEAAEVQPAIAPWADLPLKTAFLSRRAEAVLWTWRRIHSSLTRIDDCAGLRVWPSHRPGRQPASNGRPTLLRWNQSDGHDGASLSLPACKSSTTLPQPSTYQQQASRHPCRWTQPVSSPATRSGSTWRSVRTSIRPLVQPHRASAWHGSFGTLPRRPPRRKAWPRTRRSKRTSRESIEQQSLPGTR